MAAAWLIVDCTNLTEGPAAAAFARCPRRLRLHQGGLAAVAMFRHALGQCWLPDQQEQDIEHYLYYIYSILSLNCPFMSSPFLPHA